MVHKPHPQLIILTPFKETAPFTKGSIENAFNVWADPQNWTLAQKILATDFNLNTVLFTWAFNTTHKSSFILIYTCRGQFFNDDNDDRIIHRLMKESFLSYDELSGGGEVDYTFNGVTLTITIKHEYPY